MARSTFVYVTYIRTTPEKLWSALTDAEFMKQYWFGNHCESQWTAGSSWKNVYPDGRTLNELCEYLDMTRQGVTQHIALLEAANLVATLRRGREKLHFLNPVPLQEIYERWIAKFEKPRLKALSDLKQRLEKPHD